MATSPATRAERACSMPLSTRSACRTAYARTARSTLGSWLLSGLMGRGMPAERHGLRVARPTCREVELLAGQSACLGGVGDDDQPLTKEIEGDAGSFDLADEGIAEVLVGAAAEVSLVTRPLDREGRALGREISDEPAEICLARASTPSIRRTETMSSATASHSTKRSGPQGRERWGHPVWVWSSAPQPWSSCRWSCYD